MLLQSFDLYDLLIYVGTTLSFLFFYGLYRVFKPLNPRSKAAKKASNAKPAAAKLVVTSSDISAIAGDDVAATQLDLARAYIETGRHLLAKKILEHVRDHGSAYQQQEAYELLKSL